MIGFEVVCSDDTLVIDAHQLAGREQLSWFDALIAEAALRSRCSILFSEDFSHSRRIVALPGFEAGAAGPHSASSAPSTRDELHACG